MAQEKARPPRGRAKDGTEATQKQKPARKASTAPRARRAKRASASPEEIAVRAYYLWEDGEPGDAVDHWLRAEADLAAA